jgi:hypothetical protein
MKNIPIVFGEEINCSPESVWMTCLKEIFLPTQVMEAQFLDRPYS